MASDTRLPKIESAGIDGSLLEAFSRSLLGDVPEPAEVDSHQLQVPKDIYGLGREADKWRQCDPDLKSLAHMAVASLVDAASAWVSATSAPTAGASTLSRRVRWRESDAFAPFEREVTEHAEAMSHTPPTVTEEVSARLLEQFDAPAPVELTAWIAMANVSPRMNTAVGAESQGFSAAWELPLAEPTSPARDEVVGA